MRPVIWFSAGVVATLIAMGVSINTVGKDATCGRFLVIAEQTTEAASEVARKAREAAEAAKEEIQRKRKED